MHRLKKLSAVQKKRLKKENFAKNGMYRPLACVYVEILVIPSFGRFPKIPTFRSKSLLYLFAGIVKNTHLEEGLSCCKDVEIS